VLILTGALFAVVFFLIEGYEFGVSNQTVFLPVIQAYLGDTYLLQDFGTHNHLFYHLNFNYILAFLSKFLGLSHSFFLGQAMVAVLLYVSIARITRCLFEDRKILLVSFILLFLWGNLGLDGNVLWANRLEAQYISWPLTLFAVDFLLKERYNLSAFFAGLSFVFHFPLGLLTAAIIFPTMITSTLRMRGNPLRVVKAAFVYLLFFIPVFFEHSHTLFHEDVNWGHSFIDYAAFRMPHHMLFDARLFAAFLFFILLAAGSYASFKKSGTSPPAFLENHAKVLILSAITLGIGLLQYADFYQWKWGALCRLQPLRMSPLIALFGILYLSALLIRLIRHSSLWANILAILLCFLLGPRFVGYLSMRQNWLYPAVTFTVVIALIVLRKTQNTQVERSTVLLLIPLILMLISKGYIETNGGLHLKTPRFFYDMREEKNDPWVDACRWISSHAEKNALFITPPYLQGFTFYAGRKTIVEFKSGANYKKQAAEWRERLTDLSGGVPLANCSGFTCDDVMKKNYSLLDAPKIKSLAQKYGAAYLVTDAGKTYPFKMLYKNASYTVYSLAD